jgi:hypothetical protein
MDAITNNEGHNGMPARHGDKDIKNICEKYRELLNEIDREIRINAIKEEEKETQ